MAIARMTALAAALLLSACGGGGGGGDEDSGSNPAQGFYIGGADSNTRASYGVILGNGDTWVLYSSKASDDLIAGFARASMSTDGAGHFTLKSGRDYNLEGLGVNSFTGSGNYVEQDSISGTVDFGGGTTLTFNGLFDDGYNDTPLISTVQGSYSVQASSPEVSDTATMTIAASGKIEGSSVSFDCDFSGQLMPRSDGNVFDFRVTFSGGECAAPGETIRGIAFYNPATDQLIGAAVLGDRSSGAVFAGNKF